MQFQSFYEEYSVTPDFIISLYSDVVPPLPVFTSTNEISKIVIEHASSDDASLFARPNTNTDSKSPVVCFDSFTRNNKPTSGEENETELPEAAMAVMQVRKLKACLQNNALINIWPC